MQHDEVVAQDTAAALEGLDITGAAGPSAGLPRAMSSDLECAQAQDDWPDYDVTQQKGQQPQRYAGSAPQNLLTYAVLKLAAFQALVASA